MNKGCQDRLLPLTVLYSPFLRLRYRCSLAKCCNTINALANKAIFQMPAEAPRNLAVELEQRKTQPPSGTVYVEDSEGRKATDSSVKTFGDVDQFSGMVYLPESEGELSTISVTMHALCQLLGMEQNDDNNSIMRKNSSERTKVLSEQDVKILIKVLGC